MPAPLFLQQPHLALLLLRPQPHLALTLPFLLLVSLPVFYVCGGIEVRNGRHIEAVVNWLGLVGIAILHFDVLLPLSLQNYKLAIEFPHSQSLQIRYAGGFFAGVEADLSRVEFFVAEVSGDCLDDQVDWEVRWEEAQEYFTEVLLVEDYGEFEGLANILNGLVWKAQIRNGIAKKILSAQILIFLSADVLPSFVANYLRRNQRLLDGQ